MTAPTAIGPRFLAAADNAIALNVRGLGAVALQLTGTWVATVSFEATLDGRTWVALNMVPTNSATAVSSATTTGVWISNIGGLEAVRARVSAYTSGTVEAHLQGAEPAGRY